MLKRLQIQNLAILENVDVTFKEGLTCLSGETGAGKSLIIDSLSLLLGTRASADMIRAGEDRAVVRGEFEITSPLLTSSLAKKGIVFAGDTLTVERILTRGKNLVKINGQTLSLGDLAKIAPYLADIHSQFDFGKILHPERYIEMMDSLSPLKADRYKQEYTSSLTLYVEAKKRYEELLAQEKAVEKEKDFLAFQYKELKEMDLKMGEEEEIESQLALLRNYDKIFAYAQEADTNIRSDFLDHLYDLSTTLKKLGSFQKEYEEPQRIIEERYYELDDLFQTLKKRIKGMDYDPTALDELEQRESELSSLKRKYKRTLPELIEYRDSLHLALDEEGGIAERRRLAEIAKQEAFEKAYLRGEELSLFRKELAKTVEKEIGRHLSDLNLQSAFEIRFAKQDKDEKALKEDGIDEVDFYIEPNPGEGMKSLSHIASGGEASRIMLAFKALFLKYSGVSTVIFDEIDTGISGEAATKVADKISEIALSTQVIAITHTAQVASKSDHHLLVEKEVKNGRTNASVKELNLEEKITAIATMIHGKNPTEKQKEAAKELVLHSR